MTIVEDGKDWVGTYPDGKLTCKWTGKILKQYDCVYEDSTGKGAALVWHSWGGLKGHWIDAQGQKQDWRFCREKCSEQASDGASGGSGSGIVRLELKNDCRETFHFCVERHDGFIQKSSVNGGSSTTYDAKAGSRVWARSGKGLNDGECSGLIGTVGGGASSEKMYLCKR